MHSKWGEIGIELAAFHLQSNLYNDTKPISFGSKPKLGSGLIRRTRKHSEIGFKGIRKMKCWQRKKTLKLPITGNMNETQCHNEKDGSLDDPSKIEENVTNDPAFQIETFKNVLQNKAKDDGPSHFLQEAAHLLSLLSAVAFSTLRDDIESAPMNLVEYMPESSFGLAGAYSHNTFCYLTYWQKINIFLFGFTPAPVRTHISACRPFPVIGDVSDAEIVSLKIACGSLAKISLCSLWLQEFIMREFLNDSFGAVSAPIITRAFQNCSDGMLGYNQARKVAYIPFPFPHSQLSALFLVIILCFMPILMISYVKVAAVGALLNIVAVGVLVGLHEVARELEDPFRNFPNDLPLNSLHDQFNEALINMYSGYHPDA